MLAGAMVELPGALSGLTRDTALSRGGCATYGGCTTIGGAGEAVMRATFLGFGPPVIMRDVCLCLSFEAAAVATGCGGTAAMGGRCVAMPVASAELAALACRTGLG